MNIFEAVDKNIRKIRLTKNQWAHIRQEHPDVNNHYEIEETIINPLKVLYLEKNKSAYYKYFKHRKDPAKYLKVIVRYLNGGVCYNNTLFEKYKMKGQMRIYYDDEGDYLEIFIGDPKSHYGEEITDYITIFKDSKTDEVIGVGILNFKERSKDLREIKLDLPVDLAILPRNLD